MSTVWLQIMWNPLMWRFIKDMNNRMANKLFLFLFLNLDKVKNWTPGRITNIWQIQLVQIDTIRFERMQIHFLVTFSLLLSSSLL